MPRRTLAQLGWDSRRLTIVLRFDHWERLEAEAARLSLSLEDIIAGDIASFLRAQADLDRVTLTPDGEKAAEEIAAELDPAKWGKGGSEW
jgi:hypothetical protein